MIYFSETSKRRRKWSVGDIITSDLSTPECAKLHFNLAKLKIIKQRRKIKTLSQRVIRLQKNLSLLETLFEYF